MNRLEGVYLVIDPKRNWKTLLRQLDLALQGGVHIVQIWNHWAEGVAQNEKLDFLNKVKKTCSKFNVSVLMHEDWKLAVQSGLNGVHFDETPNNFIEIRAALKGKIIGATVGNDMEKIKWADEQKLTYISFCAVFPSSSVETCEIVKPENIKAARVITDLSIFLSGGIKPENLRQLHGLDFDGVAIISGILDAPDPTMAVESYLLALQRLKQ